MAEFKGWRFNPEISISGSRLVGYARKLPMRCRAIEHIFKFHLTFSHFSCFLCVEHEMLFSLNCISDTKANCWENSALRFCCKGPWAITTSHRQSSSLWLSLPREICINLHDDFMRNLVLSKRQSAAPASEHHYHSSRPQRHKRLSRIFSQDFRRCCDEEIQCLLSMVMYGAR